MKYLIQIVLVFISFFAASKAKKQFEKAKETRLYEFGIFKVIGPIAGNKAVEMAKLGIDFAKYGPWVVVLLFIMYNLIDWLR
jgi:uncharacterized membrane-anchored protein